MNMCTNNSKMVIIRLLKISLSIKEHVKYRKTVKIFKNESTIITRKILQNEMWC